MTRYRVALDETGVSQNVLDWVVDHVDPGIDSVDLVMIGTSLGVSADESIALLRTAAERLHLQHRDLRVSEEYVAGLTVRPLLDGGLPGDVVVVGIDSTTRLSDALTGWRPERVAVHSRMPVIAVPERWQHGTGAVVVGIDADTADAAVTFAAERALAEGLELIVVRAWQIPTVSTPYGFAFIEEDRTLWARQAERLVDQAIAALRVQFPTLTVRAHVREGRAATVIDEASDSASLIVVGRRHRTVIGGALFGSVGQDLLRRSATPVCTVAPVHTDDDRTDSDDTGSAAPVLNGAQR